MKPVTHVITTIERGGAEKQLLTLVTLQRKIGRTITIIPLKGALELQQEFENLGANVITELVGKSIFLQIIDLRSFFRTTEMIIHAHLPRAEMLASLAKSSRPLVFSRHNAEPFFPGAPAWISRALSKFVACRSEKGIAISKAVANYLFQAKELAKDFELSVIYYAQDNELLNSEHKFNFEYGSGPILGTIGRLVPQKDYETLLIAFKYTLTDFPQAHLVILGEGRLREYLQDVGRKLGISDRVHFIGKKENVKDYLNSFELFILASKYEGFGLVLLEAMSCNVPIVASNNSAIPEVLGVSHPGLARTSDAADFHRKIVFLLSPEGKEKALKAQDFAIDEFSPEKLLRNMEHFYSGL